MSVSTGRSYKRQRREDPFRMARHLVCLFLLFHAAVNVQSTLLMNKCCPLGYILTYNSTNNMRLDCKLNGSLESSIELKRENASNLLKRPLTGVFSWLQSNITAYDPRTLEKHEGSFLDGQTEGTFMQYGEQPCDNYHHEIVYESYDSNTTLYTNGSLMMNLSVLGGDGHTLLEPFDYCVDIGDNTLDDEFVFLACPCRKVTCIRKCRSFGEIYTLTDGILKCCENLENVSNWKPRFDSITTSPPMYHLLKENKLECGDSVPVLLNYENDNRKMKIFSNGSAVFQDYGKGIPYNSDHWCGEITRFPNGSTAENALFCEPKSRSPVSTVVAVYAALLLVSAFFLLLTLCVYALLPELRVAAHAKALMCHVAALLAGCVALACAQALVYVHRRLCLATALIIQFSFLSAFFWLNVLCFDITRAFRKLRSLQKCREGTSGRRFLSYSAYAWGGASVITGITATVYNAEKRNELPTWVVATNIGNTHCWFENKAAEWLYFKAPLGGLLLTNTILFVITGVRLVRARLESAQLTRGESRCHGRTSHLTGDRLSVYVKLFLLMGVSWLIEIVSPDSGDAKGFDAWFLPDSINMLRGFFIFVIFCGKRKVWRMLRQRFGASSLEGRHFSTASAALPQCGSMWGRRTPSRMTSVHGLSSTRTGSMT